MSLRQGFDWGLRVKKWRRWLIISAGVLADYPWIADLGNHRILVAKWP